MSRRTGSDSLPDSSRARLEGDDAVSQHHRGDVLLPAAAVRSVLDSVERGLVGRADRDRRCTSMPSRRVRVRERNRHHRRVHINRRPLRQRVRAIGASGHEEGDDPLLIGDDLVLADSPVGVDDAHRVRRGRLEVAPSQLDGESAVGRNAPRHGIHDLDRELMTLGGVVELHPVEAGVRSRREDEPVGARRDPEQLRVEPGGGASVGREPWLTSPVGRQIPVVRVVDQLVLFVERRQRRKKVQRAGVLPDRHVGAHHLQRHLREDVAVQVGGEGVVVLASGEVQSLRREERQPIRLLERRVLGHDCDGAIMIRHAERDCRGVVVDVGDVAEHVAGEVAGVHERVGGR